LFQLVDRYPAQIIGFRVRESLQLAAVGGLIASLAPGLPVSVFVTTISFVIYLVCRIIGNVRSRKTSRDEIAYARRVKALSAGNDATDAPFAADATDATVNPHHHIAQDARSDGKR